jgi:hypothetical protein
MNQKVYCVSCKVKRLCRLLEKKMSKTHKLYARFECLTCGKKTVRYIKGKKS